MRHADETLEKFGVAHECRVISAHRSPSLAAEFGSTARARIEVIIAAAGAAAHLAGVMAAHTTLPVLGVPMRSESLNGLDSLATVQMPGEFRSEHWPSGSGSSNASAVRGSNSRQLAAGAAQEIA